MARSQQSAQRRTALRGLMVAAALGLAGTASADERFWIDATGGSFGDAANWSSTYNGAGGASAPVDGDAPQFDLLGAPAYTVDFSSSPTFSNGSGAMHLSNGNDVTFDLNGNTLTYTDSIFVGATLGATDTATPVGSLTLIDGTLTRPSLTGLRFQVGADEGGDNSGGDGHFTVGAGGVFNISGGASAQFGGFPEAGAPVSGVLTIQDGGQVFGGPGGMDFGNAENVAGAVAVGTLNVTGPGSLLSSSSTGGTLNFGYRGGEAHVNITGGGVVNNAGQNGLVLGGVDSTAHVLVDGAGSRITRTLVLIHIAQGTGTAFVDITNGGSIETIGGSTSHIRIGNDAGGNATVNVTGTNSRLHSNREVHVGATSGAGLATLTVGTGGTVSSQLADIFIHQTGVLNLTGGTALTGAAAHGGVGFEDVNNDGRIQGNGTIRSAVTWGTKAVVNNGTFAPGNSIGLITITNMNFTNSSTATLEFELAGTGASEFDRVFIDSAGEIATFDANTVLEIDLIGGTLEIGDIFDLIVADSVGATLPTLSFVDQGVDGFLTHNTVSGGVVPVGFESLRLTLTAVPEPSSAAVVMLVGLAFLQKRSRGASR